MANRNVSVRLAVLDGQRVKAELQEVGVAGQRSLDLIAQGAKPASDGLDRVATAAKHAGASAPELGNLSHVVSGFVGGLAAGATTAAIGWLTQLPQAFGAVSRAAQEAAASQARIETALRVTGNASGLTAQQIIAFSDQQEAATLNTAESIQDAAAILASFKSVAGETFTRTISLAQDMAVVFGGDLSQNVTRLGKALEEPIEGLSALRKVGVSFTEQQKDVIKTLEETGQRLEAQKVILTAIEGQGVLGQAAAQAQGVTGASNSLADAWGNMLEALGQTSLFRTVVQRELDGLRGDITSLTDFISGESGKIENRLQAARDKVRERKENPFLTTFFPGSITAAENEAKSLEEPARQSAAISSMMNNAEERFAREAAERQQIELKTNAIIAERVKYEEQIAKLKNDPKDKLDALQRETEAARARLESQRTPETTADVDKAIAVAEEVSRRKRALIEEEVSRAKEAEARKGESAARAAEREADARIRAAERLQKEEERQAKQRADKEQREIQSLNNLQDAHSRLTNTQMANIDLVLKRQLEANAREIEDLGRREAADIAATQRAEEEKARLRDTTLKTLNKEVISVRAQGEEVRARDPNAGEAERTAAARAGAELRVQLEREETAARLISLQQIGLSEEDFARAREDLTIASEERIRQIRQRAATEQESQFVDAGRMAESLTRTLSSGLTELVLAGREGFSSLTDAFQTFLDGMQRQLIQTGIEGLVGSPGSGGKGGSGLLGMLFGVATTAAVGAGAGGSGGAGGGGGSILGIGSGGGLIQSWRAHSGSPGEPILAPAELWRNAPRYHSGYAPPALAPWERAAIVRKDETISTPEQMKAMRSPVNVTVNNNSREPVAATADERGNVNIDIGSIVSSALSKPGSSANQTLRSIIQSEMRSGG